MIDTSIELNISEVDLEFVQSREQPGELLEALGIMEPMFQPNDAGQADVILPTLTPGPELHERDDEAAQLASDYSLVSQSALAPELANVERLSHLAETLSHLRPDLLNALDQHPTLSGFQPGSLGNGSGPDKGFMSHGNSGETSKLDQMQWAAQGDVTKVVPNQVRQNPDGGKTVTDTAYYEGGGRQSTSVTYDSNGRVTSTEHESVTADGHYVRTRFDVDDDGTAQPPVHDRGTIDDDGERVPESGPHEQPAPDAPSTPGGPTIFDPEYDPRVNPHLPSDGKTVEQRLAELDTSQTTELTWQEQLQLKEMMVTNPGLPMATGMQTDTFVFLTPEIGPDGQRGPDPDPVGPELMYDASAAAPALEPGQAAQIVGGFPVDTIDPDDGLIGGPLLTDVFLL